MPACGWFLDPFDLFDELVQANLPGQEPCPSGLFGSEFRGSLVQSILIRCVIQDLRAAAKLHQQHSAAPSAQTISPEEKKRLQSVLDIAIKDCEECPVCYDELKEPRITTCSHRFCLACIMEVINRTAKCPMVSCPVSWLIEAELSTGPPCFGLRRSY